MPARVTVGEFARLTRLTVKTLHHYHETGVLAPAAVDPRTGYRYYDLDQVQQARLARRLRAVRMPVPQVRAVLAAPDAGTRRALIAAHLADLHRELEETAAAVADLQALLSERPDDVEVTVQDVAPGRCVTATRQLGPPALAAWFASTYPRLYAAAARLGGPEGPGGALYGTAWYTDGEGPVTAFVPVRGGPDPLPGGRFATAVHAGPYDLLDRTYAALGRHVATEGIAGPGPVRELYLVGPADTGDPRGLRTLVCWPMVDDAASGPG